jgi:hypothetical protein
MATPGYLIKRAGNGIVVLREVFISTGAVPQSTFAVEPENTMVFSSVSEAAVWLSSQLEKKTSVTSINQPTEPS